ncbi:hypothetical protein HU200_038519 [Digitaria exilis]|uniref:MYND-type domain-containing protein n=1 Tax=Digitaria exilis TaxID=1010633 RepID=A0A835BBM3_9POAL|nr:hypothetical protein HU200_038519 [Digitaria exilis]
MRKPARRRSSLIKGSRGGDVSKASRLVFGHGGGVDAFDRLPDDLVLAVLAGVAAHAASPADLAAAAMTCRRFRELAAHPVVLSRASAAAVAVRAARWSEAAHRFLRRCADAGNLHACYFLGMVSFYCLGGSSNRATGTARLARAASGGHAAALYALAVMRFNGSGGAGKADRDPRGGVALCARAAWLGHVPALRELGHCIQDGYGARRDVAAGRRLLLHAAAHELSVAEDDDEDAASRFMVEWWALRGTIEKSSVAAAGGEGGDDAEKRRLCSQARCGRRETRRHEFRRCSVCGTASYCSRACQAMDWKRAHRGQCGPAAARWLAAGNAF